MDVEAEIADPAPLQRAVRHGIDPSEDGGRIVVSVQVRDQYCHITVADTGVGFTEAPGGLGTGLATLRERLQLAYGAEASLVLRQREPHGVVAELVFPVGSDTS